MDNAESASALGSLPWRTSREVFPSQEPRWSANVALSCPEVCALGGNHGSDMMMRSNGRSFRVTAFAGLATLLSGAALAFDMAAPGDLIVSEIMKDPNMVPDNQGEWFELYNSTSTTVDLMGVVAQTSSGSFTVGSSLAVAPGDYLVFARNGNAGTNGGVTVDYVYGSALSLDNGADNLEIRDSLGATMALITYDMGGEWVDPVGASMSLDMFGFDPGWNNDPLFWCASTSAYGMGDLGTPGTANDMCFMGPDGDGDGYPEEIDCDDSDMDINPGMTDECNGVDDDCDGEVDPGCGPVCSISLLGPADGADLTAQARFMWDGDCDGYVIQVSADSAFPDYNTYWFGSLGDSPAGQAYTVGSTIWSTIGRSFTTAGYWRVLGAVAGEQVVSGSRSFFTTMDPNPPPADPVATCTVSPTAPADGASVTSSPLFDWTTTCTAGRLEISTDPTFPLDNTFYFGSSSRSEYRMGTTLWDSLKTRFAGGAYWRAVVGAEDGAHSTTGRMFTYVAAE